MTDKTTINQFLTLVQRVHAGETARSENDLSSKLAIVLSDIGLHTVLDTRVSSGGRKRPDILAYVSEQDADLVLPAELVIEAKKPEEVEGFRSLAEALVSDQFWHTKTYPYLKDNIARVQYFAFTTFTEFTIFAVTREIRNALIEAIRSGDSNCKKLRARIEKDSLSFRLYETKKHGPTSAHGWRDWIGSHLTTEALRPVPLSSTRNSIPVRTENELEQLAARLATFAAGFGDPAMPDAGLFQSVRQHVGNGYDALKPEIRRDLLIFIMSQHPGFNTAQAERLIKEHGVIALDEFVAASIHSLLSRLFAVKVIEDVFCVGEQEPLIEPELWLFATDVYDGLGNEDIRTEVFRRVRGLVGSTNPVVRRFAGYGFFFNWIEEHIDPVIFRSLVETLAIHDFTRVEGDLLGRFYELYSQQINRSRRKELGQYYTPLAIVQFMWRRAVRLVEERGEIDRLMVLDPAMGSGTFLAEGARVLSEAAPARFWERLTGFDVAAQVLGIAHVNVYMAILSQLTPEEALEVEDLRLYATDTLDFEQSSHLRQILPLIIDDDHRHFLEQRVLIGTQAKQERSYRLVIGNPPYRNNSNLTLTQIAKRFPHLLQLSVDRGGAQRRNIRDDYAWFIAAADYYVDEQGIICFILSDSFASHRSYEHFRAELLRYYHIRMLVRLGANVFSDVGYRTSFAVILLEKRGEVLSSAEETEPIPYSDLRSLIAETATADLGGPQDPRLMHLRAVARNETELQVTSDHLPAASSRFSFYPSEGAVVRFKERTVPIHERGEDRLFITKWPGIITAFDSLFKGETAGELMERMSSLFEICRTPKIREAELERRLEQWADTHGFSETEVATLKIIGLQINQSTLVYDADKIKRSFSGSIPEEARWYPPEDYVHYLYYEPFLSVPRKEHPGKPVGWGTMNQWREPLSHEITPKLIYTTASRPQNGYAAFVVNDEWYVKLHGGTSQQFNYTGFHDPLKAPRVDELPNNLTDIGSDLYTALVSAGASPDILFYYLAGIWNSGLAAELLAEVGSSIRPGIRIPRNKRERNLCLQIAELARTARDTVYLSQQIIPDQQELSDDILPAWFNRNLLTEAGFARVVVSRRRFRAHENYSVPANVDEVLSEYLLATEDQINNLVETLYS